MNTSAYSPLCNALQDVEDGLFRILKILNKKFISLDNATSRSEENYSHSILPTFSFEQNKENVYTTREKKIYLPLTVPDASICGLKQPKTQKKYDDFRVKRDDTLSLSIIQEKIIHTNSKFTLHETQGSALRLSSRPEAPYCKKEMQSTKTPVEVRDIIKLSKPSTPVDETTKPKIPRKPHHKMSRSSELFQDDKNKSEFFMKSPSDLTTNFELASPQFVQDIELIKKPKTLVKQHPEKAKSTTEKLFKVGEVEKSKQITKSHVRSTKMFKSYASAEHSNIAPIQDTNIADLTRTAELSNLKTEDQIDVHPTQYVSNIKDWLREHTEQLLMTQSKGRKRRKRKRSLEKMKRVSDTVPKIDSFGTFISELPSSDVTVTDQSSPAKQIKIEDEEKKMAFVTAAINPDSIIGALILGHTLKLYTQNKLVVLTSMAMSTKFRDLLLNVYDEVIEVPILDGSDSRIKRPELSPSLTKIECWNLTKYTKCVFLDCDTMVLQNCDELFDMEELSAVPDQGWPDCFNTGVFVYSPSNATYQALIALAGDKGSFDGGDQGLLNSYFGKDWLTNLDKRLSVVYNVIVGYVYTYSPAFQKFGSMTKIAHFIGHPKPWMAHWNYSNGNFSAQNPDSHTQNPFLQTWLDVFRDKLYGQLPEVCHELAAGGNVNTVWNLLQASKKPELYRKAKEASSSVFSESAVFQLQYRQPFHELQPMQYSDQIKTDFRSDTASPIRSTNQAQRQAAFVMDSTPPEVDPFLLRQRSEGALTFESEFTHKPRTSTTTTESSQLQVTSRHEESGGSTSLAEIRPSVKPKTSSGDKSRNRPETLDRETFESQARRRDWEEGQADYMRKDEFENIQQKLGVLFMERKFEDETEFVEMRPREENVDLTKNRSNIEPDLTKNRSNIEPDLMKNRSNIEPENQTSITDLPGYQINDFSGMHDWESGRIDYTGRHSCDNIIKRLDFLFSQESDLVPRK